MEGDRRLTVAAGSGEITKLLEDWAAGAPEALDKVLPALYHELRRLAVHYMRRERAGHSLQPTALVNEMYLRLLGRTPVSSVSRLEFFAICGQVMHRVLVEHARKRNAIRRGEGVSPLPVQEELLYAPQRSQELLNLDEALQRLAAIDARKAKVVELRYFAGMTVAETAQFLKVSPNTADRDWAFALAWLQRELSAVR
jgi:RNA polymerase sigma factor (TIGR02999 family)